MMHFRPIYSFGCALAVTLFTSLAQAQQTPSKTEPGKSSGTEATKPERTGMSPTEFTDRDLTDAELVQRLHDINVFQIAAARQAQSTASSKDVKEFASKIVEDHQKSNRRLLELARKINVPVPSTSSDVEQRGVDAARASTGLDFDRGFLINMQRTHDDAVLLLTAQVYAHPTAKDLREFTKKEISMSNDHRKKSIDILEKIGERGPAPRAS